MSRYVHVDIEPTLASIDAVAIALERLAVAHLRARAGQRLMLDGSLECAGEPVDIRFAAGTCDSVEDFGLVSEGDRLVLVCGELDRELLESRLLTPILHTILAQRAEEASRLHGVELTSTVTADGTTRIRLRSH